jgi:hypothetical protein
MSVKELSTAELEIELARRKLAQSEPPKAVVTPDWTRLLDCVQEGVAKIVLEKYQDEDFANYVYEEAIEAVYGSGFWDWKKANRI